MKNRELPPICTMLNDYASSTPSPARFHTAGHSGAAFFDSQNAFIKSLYSFCPYDITELSFSDNLLYPTTVIAESEGLLGEIFHTYKTMYVTSGTTTSILICLKSMQLMDYTLLLTKNNHSSVLHGLQLFDISHIFIENETAECIEAHIHSEKDSSKKFCLFLTTPDYFGNTKGSPSLISYCTNNGIKIIADEAHGSHLPFFKKELSALNFADIVLHSVHKTMPAACASSLIHIVNPHFYEGIKKCHRLLHTTSPSYISMATVEYAVTYFAKYGDRLYSSVLAEIDTFATELRSNEKFSIARSDDKTRLVLNCPMGFGINTAELLESHGIFAEMSDENRVVFIITPFNYQLLQRLSSALKDISFGMNAAIIRDMTDTDNNITIKEKLPKTMRNENADITQTSIGEHSPASQKSGTPNYATYSLTSLIGKICVETILLYPPSTIVALSGEIMTEKHIKIIQKNMKNVIGLNENIEYYQK